MSSPPCVGREQLSAVPETPSINLLSLLYNPLILSHVIPHLPVTSTLSLASTSHSFRTLVYHIHSGIVFRRWDISTLTSPFLRADISAQEAIVDGAYYRHTTDDMLSVDDYYSAPLRRVFDVLKKKNVLSCVTTLILDGLAVPSALLREILCDEPYNVRILSIRGVKSLGDEKLMQILRYLIRPSRPRGSPKLKGLYYFTLAEGSFPSAFTSRDVRASPEHADGVTTTAGSHLGQRLASTRTLPRNSIWASGAGNIIQCSTSNNEAWAQVLAACQGIVAFDTVICRHGPGSHAAPQVADLGLSAEGCQTCHSAPERPLIFGETPAHDLPLLSPVPPFASTVKAAQRIPPHENKKFYARCTFCMRDRRCVTCNAWWCENCYTPPSKRGQESTGAPQADIKVHMGFCVQRCLVEALYTGAGEGGMWG